MRQEAKNLNDQYISLEHVMLAFAQTPYLPESIQLFFEKYGFSKNNFAHLSEAFSQRQNS